VKPTHLGRGGLTLIESYAFERDAENADIEIDSFLGKLVECMREFLELARGDINIRQFIGSCIGKIGNRKVFILNGEERICDHPGAILIVPELSSDSLLKVLDIALACSDKGKSIGAIAFLSKGSMAVNFGNYCWSQMDFRQRFGSNKYTNELSRKCCIKSVL